MDSLYGSPIVSHFMYSLIVSSTNHPKLYNTVHKYSAFVVDCTVTFNERFKFETTETVKHFANANFYHILSNEIS